MGKKPSWIYQQSGVIPYRLVGGRVEILLITSVRRGRWIIPKGVVERHLSAPESASKEAWEEAGVSGEVSRKAVGAFEVEKWGGICTVTVYLLLVEEVADEWPESEVRKRKWMSFKEAAETVEDEALGEIIRVARALITQMNTDKD